MSANDDCWRKLIYLSSLRPTKKNETESYKACATINGAVCSITAYIVALVDSKYDSKYNNASKDHAGNACWYAVGLAQVRQQCFYYSGVFDSGRCQGELPLRIGI